MKDPFGFGTSGSLDTTLVKVSKVKSYSQSAHETTGEMPLTRNIHEMCMTLMMGNMALMIDSHRSLKVRAIP